MKARIAIFGAFTIAVLAAVVLLRPRTPVPPKIVPTPSASDASTPAPDRTTGPGEGGNDESPLIGVVRPIPLPPEPAAVPAPIAHEPPAVPAPVAHEPPAVLSVGDTTTAAPVTLERPPGLPDWDAILKKKIEEEAAAAAAKKLAHPAIATPDVSTPTPDTSAP